ncbi:hypothetical protein [Paracraurococcus lichenis]|uniref:Uncharacterized protein n=1 Tax=Paracraurococcus lichenis TaxID=3064888 RepID=A0ABT9E9P8_9PROT|nr:hypothetical protein [Paracraurococcus sp. LOR1-02]MDO9712894.1 hypothetical protein [Paracraurococcus sp. LOR1-02]
MSGHHASSAAAPRLTSLRAPVQRLCSPEPPPCPVCGTLECLCRPRWVAGQIVGEADLNRLDRYVTGKMRLHNRHLHGTGVVCGLVVHCHPCEGGLLSVSPGYALGPCGEDIVVCAPDTVPVCEMIQACRAQEVSALECRPYGNDRGCKELEEEWVLAIRYEEHAARTEPRLHASACPSCGCGGRSCSCGGKGGFSPAHPKGCGCGCGGAGGKVPPRSAPVECAPTITCEGYRYEVFRAPKPKGPRDPRAGTGSALYDRITDCVQNVWRAAEALRQATNGDDWSARVRACHALKAALVAHRNEHGTTRCEEISHLCSIDCMAENSAEADRQLLALTQAVLQDCLCEALLPPCPEPISETRIPLATFTVRGSPCRVLRVCNWTPLRALVPTFPNLLYWLSFFPQAAQIRDQLQQLCCGTPQLRQNDFVVRREAVRDSGQDPILGDLLRGNPPDVRAMLRGLNIVATPDDVTELREQVKALQAEVAALRNR